MDIQLKRGLLDVCVLAAIRSEESYGYKIMKDMRPYIVLSESTLYTILKRLEAANMLTVRTAEHGGRFRKYYGITDMGRKRIEEFKEEWQEILSIYQFVSKEDHGNEKNYHHMACCRNLPCSGRLYHFWRCNDGNEMGFYKIIHSSV